MKWIVIGAIVLCAALVGGGIYLATRPLDPADRIVPLDASYEQRLKDKGWVRPGAAQGAVELVEFADLQCPACGDMYPILEDTFNQMGDGVRFTFRHYPLVTIHNKARQAALIAEAAGRQGKFWEVEEYLYANQSSWESLSPTQFRSYAESFLQSIGLNMDQFKRDMEDRNLGDPIQEDIDVAVALKARGTPTLTVNGTMLDPLPSSSDELASILRLVQATPSPSPAP